MTLADRIRKVVAGLEDDCAVSIPVGRLREWVADEADGGDLDLEQWARAYRPGDPPSASTVRDWCNQGLIEGAYKLNGQKWLAPRESVAAFRALQQQRHGPEPRARTVPGPIRALGRARQPNTGSWRDHR